MNASTLSGNVVRLALLAIFVYLSYSIRLRAVEMFGLVIHEFDPWFNFRATQYLVDNGLYKFLDWFDDKSWYPIGRHVGSTVYPGLMATSALIYNTLHFFGIDMSLNDVCVYIPAWFGIMTSLFTAGIAYEVYDSANAAIATLGIMAISPAHLMRSVAGGYDNESVALTAIVATFYFWIKSLRTPNSWPYAIVAALSYFYMVATWGAYPFVLNMIGVHVGVLLLLQRYSSHLHLAYSIFYVLGTVSALQLHIVGWSPLTSLEQLGPMGVFLAIQFLRFLDYHKDRPDYKAFRQQTLLVAIGIGFLGLLFLLFTGRLGAFSTRVKSLFIPHTRTGNPLVDSVAEHQATPSAYYFTYFHYQVFLAPIGVIASLYSRNDAKIFNVLYATIAYYFSQKMVRLVLLLSPAAAVCSGMALLIVSEWCLKFIGDFLGIKIPEITPKREVKIVKTEKKEEKTEKDTKPKKEGPVPPPQIAKKKKPRRDELTLESFTPIPTIIETWESLPKQAQQLIAAVIFMVLLSNTYFFFSHSNTMSYHLSQTHLVLHARGRDGNPVVIDDFREAYWWLRDNTPEDSRVLAWWDYGYQINGIANRTSIADGNTWNHEHIALLGKCLVSPEKEAHNIAKYLADYVLIWTTRYGGMMGDDLAKMPHMANIAGSVYSEVPRTGWYVDKNGEPSDLAGQSLLYQLSTYRFVPKTPEPKYFKEVYTSKNRMVRIYQVLNVAPRAPFGKYAPQLKIGQFKQ